LKKPNRVFHQHVTERKFNYLSIMYRVFPGNCFREFSGLTIRVFHPLPLQHNPDQLNSEINCILENGHEASTRITNMIQQAQNKKLSVDLLTPDTLKQVFQHLQDQAESQNLELMINQPSDLFQIDTSYLHGNKTVSLILHVPMVSEENKLKLSQFIPFPLSQSLGANTTVTPKVDKDLIAIGKHHQYKILGQTDLAACTKLGKKFLCEGRSVLRTDIEDSCLGAFTYTTSLVLSNTATLNSEKHENTFFKQDLHNG
jgi:hypothetical protein